MKKKPQLKKIRHIISSGGNSLSYFFKENNTVIKESIMALLISAIGGLIAGVILGNMTSFLEAFPGLMVLIPGAIGMRGNIFGALGSRLGSHLHIGLIRPKFEKSDVLTENILSSFILTIILSVFLAFLAKGLCILLNFESMSLLDFTLISMFAGIISSAIMLPITMFVSLKSFKHGWDPDNVSTPIIAAFGDLFTLPSIIIAIFMTSFFSHFLLKYSLFIIAIILTLTGFIYGIRSHGEMRKIIRQSTPVLLLSSALGVSAGGFLNSSITTLLNNPSLLTLIPLFSGESGNLVSVLGARLSSALHTGLIDPVLKPEKTILRNFAIVIVLSILIFPIIGFLAESSSVVLGLPGLGFIEMISISTIAGMVLIAIMLLVVFYISAISYRKGFDPDNIVIPISTSTTDSISSLILISISLLVLHGIL